MYNLGRRTLCRATVFAALFSVPFSAQAQINACDLNGDGVVDDADVALAVDMALGTRPCTANVEGPATCTLVTVQRVINASHKRACVTYNLSPVTSATPAAPASSGGTAISSLTPAIAAGKDSSNVNPAPAGHHSLSDAVRGR